MRNSLPIMLLLISPLAIARGQAVADLDLLQGKWTVIAGKTGSAQKDRDIADLLMTFEFEGDKLIRYEKGIRQRDVLFFSLDLKQLPKQINLFPHRDKAKVPLLGIYAIEKDHLKLSWSKIDGKFRPESFDLPAGQNRTRQISFILKKEPEKKK